MNWTESNSGWLKSNVNVRGPCVYVEKITTAHHAWISQVQTEWMSQEQKNEYEVRLESIKEEAWGKYSNLGRAPEFKKLNSELTELDLKACSSWPCLHPIQSTTQFHQNRTNCKLCEHGEGERARLAAVKRAKMAVANAVAAEDDKFVPFKVENVASDWLIPEMATRGIELPKNGEFRTADNGARLVGSTEDSWLQVQLKANGPFKKDGTPMPNDRSQDGCAHFAQCTGYAGMLMIFVKTRIADADGKRVYTVWACDGSDMTNDHPGEHTNGTLGSDSIAPIALDALAERIRTSTLPRVTWEHMFLDVTLPEQRKEIVLMLATRASGVTVVFPVGNQTAVDCHVDGVAEQAKTFNIDAGVASAGHRVNGHSGIAYTANDGIERLREGVIVKSGDKYYLLYAHQPLHELLVHGIFAHDGYRGRPPSTGKSGIHIPLGIFQTWLKGPDSKQKVDKRCEWLDKNKALGFRRPIELNPGDYGIPIDWLKAAAQEAADPSAFPSDTELDELDAQIAKVDAGVEREAKWRGVLDATKAPEERKMVKRQMRDDGCYLDFDSDVDDDSDDSDDCDSFILRRHQVVAKKVAEDRRATEAAADRAEAAANEAKEYAERSEAASSSGAGPSYVNCNIITINGDVTEPAAKRLCQSSIQGFLQ